MTNDERMTNTATKKFRYMGVFAPAPSPSPRPSPLGRGGTGVRLLGQSERGKSATRLQQPKHGQTWLPLPKGEGRGEGEGSVRKPRWRMSRNFLVRILGH